MTISTRMMSLGDYIFAIDSAAYQELERENSWRWPANAVIGTKPKRQFTGEDEDSIRLNGIIFPHFVAQRRGLDQLPLMRQEAGKGVPLMMVDGTGRVWGRMCILSIRERQKTFFSNGMPRCIEFGIELSSYG